MTTQAIVTEKNNTVIVEQKQPQVIVAGMIGPQGVTTLEGLSNVDITNLTNGGLLVYQTQVQKWVATTTLDAQNMEGGYY
jgi:hypothetical protein